MKEEIRIIISSDDYIIQIDNDDTISITIN